MQTPGEPTIRRRTLHTGAKFDYEEVTLLGTDGVERSRQMVRHPGAVCICPVLVDDSGRISIVFIKNNRFALGEELLELPAGTLEAGEEPGRCAGRELVEETGYQADEIVALGSFWTTPGMTDERMHAFAAFGLRHVGQDLEADERITVEMRPLASAQAALESGELEDAKSIVTLERALRFGVEKAVGG